MTPPRLSLHRHLTPDDLSLTLRADVRAGLTADAKTLPPKYFYDERGSRLFDEITRLPEYYPTRAERSLLDLVATEVARTSAAEVLVELGSGTSEKTRVLLHALAEAGTLQRFVPFDVDETVLAEAGEQILAEFPGLDVQAVVGDFERHLGELPREGRRLVAFLGSTIGNLEPAPRATFLRELAAGMGPGDFLLLGTDLVKDTDRLLAAYDDSAGVTAAFDKNVLSVLNRELGADFDLAAFDHVAVWDAGQERVEMRLRARHAHEVRLPGLDLAVSFDAGEEVRTEVSSKFRRESVVSELAAAGLDLVRWWTDPAGDVALSLASPRVVPV